MTQSTVESIPSSLPLHPKEKARSCSCGSGCGCGSHGGAGHAHGHKGRGISKKFRRVHSIAGGIFGLFLAVHLFIALTANRPALFTRAAGGIEKIAHAIPGAEVLLALVPLALLALSGGYLLFHVGLKYNVDKCNRGGMRRFFLQRISALCILLFLALHLARFGLLAVLPAYDSHHAFNSTLNGVRQFWSSLPASHPLNVAVYGFYLLGAVAVSYHFSNGLMTAASARGYFASSRQTRTWGRLCVTIGIAFGVVGVLAWRAFLSH